MCAKDFGAVGDGIADDTAAIQSAIDSVGASTTTCYVRACSFTMSEWAAKVCCNSAYFHNCIFEACTRGGVDVYRGSTADFSQCYTEAVDGFVYQAGVTGDSDEWSVIGITGGSCFGSNGGVVAGSAYIDLGLVANCTATGVSFARADYLIRTTDETQNAVFVGWNTRTVSKRMEGVHDKARVAFLGGQKREGTNYSRLETNRIDFTRYHAWQIREVYSYTTPGDLVFENKNTRGPPPIRLSNVGEIYISRVTFSEKDMAFIDSAAGPVLTAPSGSKWRLGVDEPATW